MAVMPRQAAFTPVSSSLLLNVYAAEIERGIAGTFGNLTNTSRPRFLVIRTSNLPVSNITDTSIPWQTTVTDPRAMWTASTPDIITIRDAGDWIFFGQERWPASSAGVRAGKILKNGTDPTIAGVAQSSTTANPVNFGEGTSMGFFTSCRAVLNDVMRLNAWQNAGGTTNLLTDFGGTYFGGLWLGP